MINTPWSQIVRKKVQLLVADHQNSRIGWSPFPQIPNDISVGLADIGEDDTAGTKLIVRPFRDPSICRKAELHDGKRHPQKHHSTQAPGFNSIDRQPLVVRDW